MSSYAAMIEDSAASARWRARLLAEYPSDPRSLVAMIGYNSQPPSADSARALLPRFDKAWTNRSDARDLTRASSGSGWRSRRRTAWRSGDGHRASTGLPAPGIVLFQSSFLADPLRAPVLSANSTALVRELLAEPRVSRDLYYTRQQDSLRRRFVAANALVTLSDGMLSASATAARAGYAERCGAIDLGRALASVWRRCGLSRTSQSAVHTRRLDGGTLRSCVRRRIRLRTREDVRQVGGGPVMNRSDRTIVSPARCPCWLFAVTVMRITLSACSSTCAKTSR